MSNLIDHAKEELRRQLNSWLIEANGSGTASCPLCNTHPDRICIWHSARLDNLLHLITTYGIEERIDELETQKAILETELTKWKDLKKAVKGKVIKEEIPEKLHEIINTK